MMAMGELELQCVCHPRVKALFAQCDGFSPPPSNNMEIPAHILDGRIEDVAMEMSNLLIEGKSILTSQVEGVQNFSPATNNIEGPKNST